MYRGCDSCVLELGLLLGDEPAITKTVLKRAKEIKATLNAVSLHKKNRQPTITPRNAQGQLSAKTSKTF